MIKMPSLMALCILFTAGTPAPAQQLGQPCCAPSYFTQPIGSPDCVLEISSILMRWGRCSGFCQAQVSPCILEAVMIGQQVDLAANCNSTDLDFVDCEGVGSYAVTLNCSNGCD